MEPLARALRTAREGGRPIAVPYVMVDRRRRARLAPLLAALAEAGATAVELGFPFSDPIADGPVLEAAADEALRHGTDWSDLLEQVRVASQRLPTAVMTYANPVWRHGLSQGLGALAKAGASGLIVPDLSLEESGPWRSESARHGLALVLLAAPGADPGRMAALARASRGFLYLVSRYGTTGAARPTASPELGPLVKAARRAAPRLPVLVGFGVRDPLSARTARASGADGVIVGSALERKIASGASVERIGRWFGSIARAVPSDGR